MVQRQQRVPFSGRVRGEVSWELSNDCQPFQPVRTHWRAEGSVAPLGVTAAIASHCADDGGGGFNGRITFTAENADTLLATYTFRTLSMTPTLLEIEMTGSFVEGGTGRFVHPGGGFVAVVHVHTTTVPPTVETIWPFELDFDGSLKW